MNTARYQAIVADFGWDPRADRAAADQLAAMVPRGAWRHVGTELKHRPLVTVVGCGPSLASLQAADLPHGIVVAADGATKRLQEIGVVPRVVVTDLDGDMDALHWAAKQGSSIVVHAHGDNMERLDAVPSLGPLVAGTSQGCAPGSLKDLGGLTDGDRAVLLCQEYGVKQIRLACFEFDANPSDYSGAWDPDTKARKLHWARRIIQEAAQHSDIAHL